MKELEYNENIIEDLGLTEMQILNIISVWYVNGMMPDIIQNEDGLELDELVDGIFFTSINLKNEPVYFKKN